MRKDYTSWGERHRRLRNQADDQIYRKEEKVLLFGQEWCHCNFIIRRFSSDMEKEHRTNSKWSKVRHRRAVVGEKRLHGASKRKSKVHSPNPECPSDSACACVLSLWFWHSTTKTPSAAMGCANEMRQVPGGLDPSLGLKSQFCHSLILWHQGGNFIFLPVISLGILTYKFHWKFRAIQNPDNQHFKEM